MRVLGCELKTLGIYDQITGGVKINCFCGLIFRVVVVSFLHFVIKKQLNGANGEWTGTDDLEAINRLLKSSWLYTLVLIIKFLVMNIHRVLYLLLAIAVKIRSLIFTYQFVYEFYMLCYRLEVDWFHYMTTVWGFVQVLLLYNIINYLFNVEADFQAIARAVNVPMPVVREEQEGGLGYDGGLDPYEIVQEFFGAVRGGAKGKRMVSGKVKNKGSGGKSKVNKPIQAPVREEAEEQPSEKKAEYSNFVHSDFPKLRTRFKSVELVTGTRFIDFDCHGAPFCGLTCIDIACGIKPDLKEYLRRAEECPVPYDLGTNQYLEEYANYRGVNLAMMGVVAGDRIARTINSPAWDYVVLRFTPGVVVEGEEPVGHWTLCCTDDVRRVTGNREDPLEILGVGLNITRTTKLWTYITGLVCICFTFVVTSVYVDMDKVDRREVTHKRDPSEIDDTYLIVNTRFSVRFMGFRVEIPITHTPFTQFRDGLWEFIQLLDARIQFVNNNLPAYLRFDFFFIGDSSLFEIAMNFILNTLLDNFAVQLDSYFADCFKEYLPRVGMHVSLQRFKKCYLEAQTLSPENRELALSLISQTRYVNTNVQIPMILHNTRYFSKWMIKTLDRHAPDIQIQRVAVNAANSRSIVANQQVILGNQQAAVNAVGAGRKPYTNYVKKAKLHKLVVNRVIAQSPTISFVNHGKQLGPGNISVTDDFGLLAAFCGRSMSKDPTKLDYPSLKEFEKFSKRFIDRLVGSMDFSGIEEEDPRVAISRLYAGKKPQAFIDSLVQGYTDYLSGKAGKKYKQPSCFNKLENSSKVSEGKVRTKPRLIMVMSELMLVEYSQVLDVISRWNEGFVKRFQIKHETEEEIVRKVIEVTSKNHMVTDYSSFECSVIGKVRQIENYCIKSCLKRAGLKTALRRFTKDFDGPRTLINKDMQFHIDSRNSGDFHTSWMNGLVNILIGAYTYALNNPDDPRFVRFNMIAEGDDGLRKAFGGDEEIAKTLGFGFSMSTNGTHPGDVDFLRSRWIGKKRYLNVARCLKIAWTLSGKTLSASKSKQIQRCSALSLNAISPGHPILWALVKRILEETKPNVLSNKMKEYFKHTSYTGVSFEYLAENCAKGMPEVKCDEEMRKYVAMGAADFPPISLSQQLALEKLILDKKNKVINLIGILDDYEDVFVYSESEEWKIKPDQNLQLSEDMKTLIKNVGAVICKDLKIVDGYEVATKYKMKFEEEAR